MKVMKYTALAVAACFMASSALAGIVAHYSFDNAADLGENTGTETTLDWNQSSGATAIAGKFGGAGAFDGANTQFWDSDFSKANVDLSSFSVSMHVRGNPGDWTDYISLGQSGVGVMFFEKTSSGTVAIWDNGIPGGSVGIESTTLVNDGNWHHLGMVSDGATLTLYVDGVSQGSHGYTGSGTVDAFQIGARWADGRNVVADIDDVGVWNTALSAGEMAYLSSNAIPEPATLGMVAAFGGGILLIRRKLML